MTDLPAAETGDAMVETGDATVDEALRTLEGLAERDLREHVAVFDAVHRALSDRLADGQG